MHYFKKHLKICKTIISINLFSTSNKMSKSKFEYVRDFEVENKCLHNCWIVLRLDGKSFHKFTDAHNFEKPNDKRGLELMTRAAATVLGEFRDICFAFGHSDEYSFVFKKETAVYNRRYDKILTNVNSLFASSYVFYWKTYFSDIDLIYPPSFDSRIVLYPTDKNLRDYLSWRQADVHVNNLYNTVFWALVLRKNLSTRQAEEKLKGTVSSDKNEILFQEFGINYNKEPELFRKGTSLVRKRVKSATDERLTHVVIPLNCDIISDKFWDENPDILQGAPLQEFDNVLNLPTFNGSTPQVEIKQK
uniref:tRNA(His) guanylyltransferase n=1 Tax=Clastoptera arizonana TaxID=38151 RepID=A0A1B6CM51_9HEMI